MGVVTYLSFAFPAALIAASERLGGPVPDPTAAMIYYKTIKLIAIKH